MHAFLSYHNQERAIAGAVAGGLEGFGVTTFLAHEDIEVSAPWQTRILEELETADLFVAILTGRYLTSYYCLQESGIAIHRGKTIIPLSIDGTIPPGFMSVIQSSRIDPENPDSDILLAGIAKCDVEFAIDAQIGVFAESGSFRTAEASFRSLQPYLGQATNKQIVTILRAALANGQIAHAADCAREYLPPLLKSHGRLLEPGEAHELSGIFAQYRRPPR